MTRVSIELTLNCKLPRSIPITTVHGGAGIRECSERLQTLSQIGRRPRGGMFCKETLTRASGDRLFHTWVHMS